nr:integrase, catalytic region, zinc finger, CCHC-type, peptidase aspartic, catalytic [Tanacetum cinerariifolium]
MANLLEDIQCASSDTRPPMLDRDDFASWQQRIRLYCRGKENWVNILKSIDEGPFQIGTLRETLAEGEEEVKGTIQGAQVQLVMEEFRTELGMQILVKQDTLSVITNDNVYQADECDALDSNVDEDPTAQTMFMANLSSAYPVYDEAGPLYDSNILSEYVKDNVEPVVQSNVSSVPDDAYMMIINEMNKQVAQYVFANKHNKVVNASLTAELARYKEQLELYERGPSLN